MTSHRERYLARLHRKVRRRLWLRRHGMPPEFWRGFRFALGLSLLMWAAVGYVAWRICDG